MWSIYKSIDGGNEIFPSRASDMLIFFKRKGAGQWWFRPNLQGRGGVDLVVNYYLFFFFLFTSIVKSIFF